ncbi:MAG: hypothetical protein ACK4JE_01040 [Endomicrobiia bacterium]
MKKEKSKIIKVFFITHCSLIIALFYIYASEIVDSAYQIEKGKFRAVIYYSSFENKPSFQVKEKNKQIYGIPGWTESEISCSGKGEHTLLKVLFNPFEGFVWWGKLGSSNYTLEVPSYSVTNKFEVDGPGIIAGFGLRYQIFPETIVNPGICLDFGISASEYKFKKFSVDGDTKGIINNRFESIEGQFAFILSKRYKKFEPYFGAKVFRNFIKMVDGESLSSVEGVKDNISVFCGTKIRVYKMEWFILEGSFLNETNITLGFGVGL